MLDIEQHGFELWESTYGAFFFCLWVLYSQIQLTMDVGWLIPPMWNLNIQRASNKGLESAPNPHIIQGSN